MLGEKVHNGYLDLRKNVVIFRREKMVDVKKTQTTVTAAKELSADEKVEEAKRYTDELVNKALVVEEDPDQSAQLGGVEALDLDPHLLLLAQ